MKKQILIRNKNDQRPVKVSIDKYASPPPLPPRQIIANESYMMIFVEYMKKVRF